MGSASKQPKFVLPPILSR